MKIRADLHIHTVLSPCGDLDMSPSNIIRCAYDKDLRVIGITDHNSTRQSGIIRELGRRYNIKVLTGAEITTQEEAHCLAFFEQDDTLFEFQQYLDAHLPNIPNNPDKFGYQVVVNIHDEIIYQEEKLLISAIDQDIEEIEKKVKQYNGIFIPAHVDKSRFSIFSQLGFIPGDLSYDALEISAHTTYEAFLALHPELQQVPLIQSSDAHYLEDIGKVFTLLETDDLSFESLRKAIQKMIH